jgi:hypothetical protein
MRHCWATWRSQIAAKLHARSRATEMCRVLQSQKVKAAVTSWTDVVACQKDARQALHTVVAKWRHYVLAAGWSTWRFSVEMTQMSERARKHFVACTTKQAFCAWAAYARYTTDLQAKAETVVLRWTRAIKHAAFTQWADWTIRKRHQREQTRAALQLWRKHEHCLGWNAFVDNWVYIQQLRSALRHFSTECLRKGFIVWHERVEVCSEKNNRHICR